MAPPPDKTDPQPGKEAGAANLEDDWKIAVAQAETIAQMRGNCPGAATRTVNELKQAQVSWREVLREFIRRSARDDYVWNRVNQRHLTRGFILPALHSERMGRLVCAVDTSGSIDHEILAEFQAEVQAALDELRPEAVKIIVCDAKVHATQRFEPGEEVRIGAKGGGGTDFPAGLPADRRRQGAGRTARPVVYFTDLQGAFPNHEPEYPVLWAACKTRAHHYPPWGELVKVS